MASTFDLFDGICLLNGLVLFAPAALLIRTQAGVSPAVFLLLQALLSAVVLVGEVPSGLLTDRIGYKNTLVLSQFLLLLARLLLLSAFLLHSVTLFALEAVIEGISCCFLSGTNSAYLYEVYGKEEYLGKLAHTANCSTIGFLLSTILYGVLFQTLGLAGLMAVSSFTCGAAAFLSLFLKKERSHGARTKKPCLQVLGVFRCRKAALFVLLSSALSGAWILVNFFYVTILQEQNLAPAWLSPIILLYSALQLLGEKIIRRCERIPAAKAAVFFCALCGGALVLFARVHGTFLLLGMMVLLPLLLELPECYLQQQENELIDSLKEQGARAAALSVLNMGVNLMEIAQLSACVVLQRIGARVCFLSVGLLLTLGAAVLWLWEGQNDRS